MAVAITLSEPEPNFLIVHSYRLTILRGTGMRLGELLDLELDCLWDPASHGTWLKVPLGKLGTERMVPLDAETLAAVDAWTGHRGPQRALAHPRHGHPADFLFMERGRRLSGYRLRHGLEQAVAAAGLRGPDHAPLRVTPTSSVTPTARVWSTPACRCRP
jgi:integrase